MPKLKIGTCYYCKKRRIVVETRVPSDVHEMHIICSDDKWSIRNLCVMCFQMAAIDEKKKLMEEL